MNTCHRYNMDCWDYLKNVPDNYFQATFTDPPYLDGSNVNMEEIRRVTRGAIVMFCAPLKPFFTPQYLSYWFKPPAPKNTSARMQQSNVEWILIEFPISAMYNPDLFWANYVEVYQDVLLTKPVHPFEKPVSLWERLMMIYADPSDKRPIFDPYFGSGSSLKAAQRCGLNSVGCEISETWFHLSDGIQ
jgi:DNA modification methylase